MRITDFTTLTFDCYGTLIDWESGLVEALRPWRVRTGIAVTEAELLEAFGREETAAQIRAPAMRYPDILGETLRAMAARWQAVPTAQEVQDFAASVGDWPAFPDTAPALVELKRHFRMAILSNVDRASFAQSATKLGIDFDHVFTAEEIDSYKPDPRNFRFALARLHAVGVAPAQVLHVAQSVYHDHVPAKALGLATLWLNRPRRWPGAGATPRASATPDWEVHSLAQAVRLLRPGNG